MVVFIVLFTSAWPLVGVEGDEGVEGEEGVEGVEGEEGEEGVEGNEDDEGYEDDEDVEDDTVPTAELQNDKSFTRSKTFKPNFTRRKATILTLKLN